ncbi:MAG: nucleoside triphosphate pyrophosphatase [Synergistales bacterium]|jgi:septum formation protein
MTSLVLASISPRRKSLLTALGWKFHVVDPAVGETNGDGELPKDLCRRLAMEKARAVSLKYPGELVIGADTIVALEGEPLGKPKDEKEALKMIRSLSGRCHDVMTGIAVCQKDRCLVDVEVTRVKFRPLSSCEIGAYVSTGEGRDKAGAYAIQGKGALLVSEIQGCYFNVVGLPLYRLSLLIDRFGIPLSRQWEEFR